MNIGYFSHSFFNITLIYIVRLLFPNFWALSFCSNIACVTELVIMLGYYIKNTMFTYIEIPSIPFLLDLNIF